MPFPLWPGFLKAVARATGIGPAPRRGSRRRPARLLVVEALEERTLLSGLSVADRLTFDSAAPVAAVVLDPSGSGTAHGTIDTPNDNDVFQFVAPSTGQMTLRDNAVPGTKLDTLLAVFNGARQLLTFNDDGDHGTDSLVRFPVVAGQTYYAQAGQAFFTFVQTGDTAPLGGLGGYDLLFSTAAPLADDYGNTLGDATDFPINVNGRASLSGTIERPGDVDSFRFVAPQTGTLTFTQQGHGSGLVSYLYAFDGSGHEVLSDYDLPRLYGATSPGGPKDSSLQLSVVAGQTYFIQAAGFRTSTSTYTLTADFDDFGNLFATAHTIALGADDSGSQAGNIEEPGDRDEFTFVAPASGLLVVQLKAAPGSPLDSALLVSDSTPAHAQIAANDDFGGTLDSQVQFFVNKGQTYFLTASGFGDKPNTSTTGRYTLTFSLAATDDFGDTPAQAGLVRLDSSGSAVQSGTINSPADVDVFQFVAPVTGRLTVQLDPAAAASDLLTRLDAAGVSLGASGSQLQFDAVVGQALYVRVASPAGVTGPYTLTFITAAAPSTAFTTDSAGMLSADVTPSGGTDLFQFTAPGTGLLNPVSTGALSVFDQKGQPVALDNLGQFLVVQGQTDFLQAAAPVHLTLAPLTSNPIALGSNPFVSQNLALAQPGRADLFKVVVSPLTAVPGVSVDATGSLLDSGDPSKGLESVLSVYDATGQLITENDGTPSQLRGLALVQGQSYYLRFASADPSRVGPYTIALKPDFDDFSEDPSVPPLRPVVLNPLAPVSQSGVIESLGDSDVFQFVAPLTSVLTVQAQSPSGSSLRVSLTPPRAPAEVEQISDSLLRFTVLAGQTYSVAVTVGQFQAGQTAAPYTLVFAPVVDTLPNAPAPSLPPLRGPVLGTIERFDAVNVFRVVAPSPSLMKFDLNLTGGALDGVLSLLDAQGIRIGGGESNELSFLAPEGGTFFVEVAALKESAGDYGLTFEVNALPPGPEMPGPEVPSPDIPGTPPPLEGTSPFTLAPAGLLINVAAVSNTLAANVGERAQTAAPLPLLGAPLSVVLTVFTGVGEAAVHGETDSGTNSFVAAVPDRRGTEEEPPTSPQELNGREDEETPFSFALDSAYEQSRHLAVEPIPFPEPEPLPDTRETPLDQVFREWSPSPAEKGPDVQQTIPDVPESVTAETAVEQGTSVSATAETAVVDPDRVWFENSSERWDPAVDRGASPVWESPQEDFSAWLTPLAVLQMTVS